MNSAASTSTSDEPTLVPLRARCCIVGGGPAGMMLACLLAHRGIDLVVLESHKDFNRDFRGDTVHPSTLEALAALGLVDDVLSIPHAEMRKVRFAARDRVFTFVDFAQCGSKYPYIAMIPQARLLDRLARHLSGFGHVRLLMGAAARGLIERDGAVRGVRYQTSAGSGEVEASLTVGCDGRFSRLQTLAGFEPVASSPPMDVLWFSLPKADDAPTDGDGTFRIGAGHLLIRLDRGDSWQMGWVVPKGGYDATRKAGIEAFRASIKAIAPELSGQVETLCDWKQVTPLVVESSRLRCWHKPGLLLIGDAAHVMSPVGGIGINFAVQDAIATSDLLAKPLALGTIDERDLAAVQRRRELPTRLAQMIQGLIQERVIGRALQNHGSTPFRPPAPFLLPFFPSLVGFAAARGSKPDVSRVLDQPQS